MDKKAYNDFLDDVLDGKPYFHVDTPEFRRALERRARERALRWSKVITKWS